MECDADDKEGKKIALMETCKWYYAATLFFVTVVIILLVCPKMLPVSGLFTLVSSLIKKS